MQVRLPFYFSSLSMIRNYVGVTKKRQLRLFLGSDASLHQVAVRQTEHVLEVVAIAIGVVRLMQPANGHLEVLCTDIVQLGQTTLEALDGTTLFFTLARDGILQGIAKIVPDRLLLVGVSSREGAPERLRRTEAISILVKVADGVLVEGVSHDVFPFSQCYVIIVWPRKKGNPFRGCLGIGPGYLSGVALDSRRSGTRATDCEELCGQRPHN